MRVESDDQPEAIRAGQARTRAAGKSIDQPPAVFHRDVTVGLPQQDRLTATQIRSTCELRRNRAVYYRQRFCLLRLAEFGRILLDIAESVRGKLRDKLQRIEREQYPLLENARPP